MKSTRLLTIALMAAVALGTLSACVGAPPSSAPTDTGGPVPTVTASPEPTPEPQEPASCENLLDAENYAQRVADGYVLTPPEEFAQKMRDEANLIALFADNGGALCQWGQGSEAVNIYGFSSITPEQAATVQDELASRDYLRSDYQGGVAYTDMTLYDPLLSHYYFLDGYWFVGFGVEQIDELVANAPIR